ncbi:MAG TPA: sigma-54-dependent Fis family transcriptional regulator, partial [Firmicutes bacterium]|nr:sigma-54-dependent Fis family transcriptional regulator [Bacillota bacterium]
IEEGKFREDLYYRLNVFPIYIPSLVERRADIPLLAQYYLHALGEDYNRPDTELSPAAARMLQEYHWPGNVREL